MSTNCEVDSRRNKRFVFVNILYCVYMYVYIYKNTSNRTRLSMLKLDMTSYGLIYDLY